MSEGGNKLKAIDFFCGGGGMTCGFLQAGITVLGGIDIESELKETYEKNNSPAKFIQADVKTYPPESLANELRIERNDDNLIFIGCSPCQYWSNMNTIRDNSESTRNLLEDFQRFVEYYNPGYIVIENVPGIINRPGSPLGKFLAFLTEKKYKFKQDVLNASHYGVPQTRRRYLLIASRVAVEVNLPLPDTKENAPKVRDFIGDYEEFPQISAGYKDKTESLHTTAGLSDKNKKRLALTPHNGGTREAWSKTDLQIPAYVGKDDSFKDVYGRMFWEKPAPTLTTKFYSITNGRFAHPEQDRGISLREGATLQTFRSDYVFYSKSMAVAARIIGNAVPPQLSLRIAKTIKELPRNG